MTIILPPEIEDDELLYRAFPNTPMYWKPALQTFSSAIFKDSFGASVDRKGDRSESEVIADFEKRMPDRGLACILAKDCRKAGVKPIAKPEVDNPYHAEIHDDGDNIEIPRKKLQKLKAYTHLVKLPK